MLSTPLICSSMGVATDCARVSESAPTKVACSFVSGGTILGNCEMGSPRIVMAPMMTVRIAITMATIGRLMKNLDISSVTAGRSIERNGCNRAAGFDFLSAFRDDLIARHQTGADDPHRVDALTGLNGANGDLVISSHHGDLSGSLKLRYRALRYE